MSQYLKIVKLLESGKTVAAEAIKSGLPADFPIYRLSTYMYDIRKHGGKVEVEKSGKTVTGYRLLNPEHFVKMAAQKAAEKAIPVTKKEPITKAAKSKDEPMGSVAPVFAIDPDFDSYPSDLKSLIG